MSSFRPHFPYDARGNLLTASRSGASDSQAESYTYNLLGNMTSYTKNGTTTGYTYDSSGLRTSKTSGGSTTRYYLSGGMVLNEGTVTNSGVTLSATNYIGNEIFARKQANQTQEYYLLSNGHGDIEAVMQYSTRVGTYQYDAYGNITAMNEADGLNNPIRYAGEYFDEESGNYYLRARYYNPSLGRFMAEDTHWNIENMIYGDDQKTTQVVAVYSDNNSMFDLNIEQQTKLNNFSANKEDILYISEENLAELGLNVKLNNYASELANGLQKQLFDVRGGNTSYYYTVYDVIRTPDVSAILQANNLYVYCMDNPMTYIDPLGWSSTSSKVLNTIAAGLGIIGGALVFIAPEPIATKVGGGLAIASGVISIITIWTE